MVQNIHLASRINTRIFPVAEGFYEIFPNIFFYWNHIAIYTLSIFWHILNFSNTLSYNDVFQKNASAFILL